jgi:glycosyltransferase involved in cell wall biosynthesis
LNNEVAFLVNPEPKDMARGIIKALNQDGNSDRIVENAKKLYEQKYSRPVYVEKMRRVLQLLIKTNANL